MKWITKKRTVQEKLGYSCTLADVLNTTNETPFDGWLVRDYEISETDTVTIKVNGKEVAWKDIKLTFMVDEAGVQALNEKGSDNGFR
jgi:hypothetical protein